MLSIRMQRLGRKGHSMYRIVVQDSRRAPTSGKYVALLGNYDPHTKKSNITKDEAAKYLKNGAQPSDRVVQLFKSEKITIPKWVQTHAKQKRSIKNLEKLRKNRPAEEKPAEPAVAATTEEPAAELASTEAASEDAPAEKVSEESEKTETIKDESGDIEKNEDETKTPPNEDEFPEDNKDNSEEEKSN